MKFKVYIRLILTSLSLSVLLSKVSAESHVTLYEDAGHKGATHYMRFTECENLPSWLNDRPSSLNTHGTCVSVCEHAFCDGLCVSLYPGSHGHHNLSEAKMDNSITSVKPCTV